MTVNYKINNEIEILLRNSSRDGSPAEQLPPKLGNNNLHNLNDNPRFGLGKVYAFILACIIKAISFINDRNWLPYI
jgi:hypothetical protein